MGLMEPDRWNRLQLILDDALALPERERDSFLQAACRVGDQIDADLLAEVDSLLKAAIEADTAGALASPFSEPPSADPAPVLPFDRLGSWRTGAFLGSGGMGAVYEAFRADGAFEMRAAVKLIHAGTGDSFRSRFLLERKVLARLDHPGIARLIDGGVAPDGRPYIVMERVEGDSVTAFSTTHALPIEERLHLFLQICDAVDFAHRALVVHRDLKPNHAIVTEDERGNRAVKLLDFGVAKLMDVDDPEVTVLKTGPATPRYAAPEQITGESITTATDVYSLGIILYELLTGVRPYEVDSRSPSAIERTVVHSAPSPPSTRVGDSHVSRRIRGDLDNIALRALEKEPERRYASAAALADDLRRHLEGRPILAVPPAKIYLVRKFVRRNALGVSAAAAFALVLVAGLAGTIHQARIAAHERDIAERRFELTREVANILVHEVDNLLEPIAGTTRVREQIVERALQYLERLSFEAGDNAVLQLEIAEGYLRVGEILGNPNGPSLGRTDDAALTYRRGQQSLPSIDALPSDRRHHGRWTDAKLSERLAEVLAAQGDPDSATVVLARAVESFRENLKSAAATDRDVRSLAIALMKLGDHSGHPHFNNAGRAAEAESHYEAMLSVLGPLLDREDGGAIRLAGIAHERLGTMKASRDDLDGALADYEASKTIRLALGRESPHAYGVQRDVGIAHEKIADLLRRQGRTREARQEMHRAFEVYQRLAANEPENFHAALTLGVGHLQLGDTYVADGDQAADIASARRHYLLSQQILRPLLDADPANAQVANLIEMTNSRLAELR
jgi:eukaryotic-like serine/threonine-protein kinase